MTLENTLKIKQTEKNILETINKMSLSKEYESDIMIMPYPDNDGFASLININDKNKKEPNFNGIFVPEITLSFNPSIQRNYTEIINLIIDEKLQGKGYGRTLYEMVEDISEGHNISRICIPHCTNKSFWEYMGFEHKEDSHLFYSDYWIKEL